MVSSSPTSHPLWQLGFATLQELETEQGILASGKEEIYGCIFGRDSLITSLKLLTVYEKTKTPYLLHVVKKVLTHLVALQGQTVNIESGEEPGKCIHEFRPQHHEHLTQRSEWPWYVYPDQSMRNYDTVDATPLLLWTIHRYYELTQDETFLQELLPSVYHAIQWIFHYGDSNDDGFVDYRFHPSRSYGGLRTQSWMDSQESVFHEDGSSTPYPIAPVEVQAYTYIGLRRWSVYFADHDPTLATELRERADALKQRFNDQFILSSPEGTTLAFAIDGNGKPLISARSSIGHCLWATWKNTHGDIESIVKTQYIPDLVRRILAPDLFEPQAGIRTLSTHSMAYEPNSYHNGSIWPHDTTIVAAGLEQMGYREEAQRIRQALVNAYTHFQTPIELFVHDGSLLQEYRSQSGQTACKKQAWSAAALLDISASLLTSSL